jgi:hypothetical protein
VAQEAKLFSYRVDRTTGAVLADLRPGNDHAMDALRYSLQERIRRLPGGGLLAWYAQQNGAQAPAQQPQSQAQPPDNPHASRPGESLIGRARQLGGSWSPL